MAWPSLEGAHPPEILLGMKRIALFFTSDNTGYVALGTNARARERWQHMVRTPPGTRPDGGSRGHCSAHCVPSAVPPGTGILGKESEQNTTQETRMKPLSILLVTLLVFPLPAWSKDLLLFVIQRSKNANEVHYLRVDAHCHLASATPVHALWKLLEGSPEQTKPCPSSISWPMGSRSRP